MLIIVQSWCFSKALASAFFATKERLQKFTKSSQIAERCQVLSYHPTNQVVVQGACDSVRKTNMENKVTGDLQHGKSRKQFGNK